MAFILGGTSFWQPFMNFKEKRGAILQNNTSLAKRMLNTFSVILHNMIIKDEHVLDLVPCFDWQIICMKYGLKFEQYAKGINEIEISNNHFNLKDNLVKQLRVLKGGNIIANGIQ